MSDIQIKPTTINGSKRYCVVDTDAPQVKGFKGQSSGKMFYGCFTEKGAAEERKRLLESGQFHGVKSAGKKKSKKRGKRKGKRKSRRK